MPKDTIRKADLIYKRRASLFEGVYQIHPNCFFGVKFLPTTAPPEEGSWSGEEGILTLKNLLWWFWFPGQSLDPHVYWWFTEAVKRSEQIFGGEGINLWKTLSLLEREKLLNWKGSPSPVRLVWYRWLPHSQKSAGNEEGSE